MNKELVELGKQYFKLYPKRKELYITEDKNVFLDKSPAKDHAAKTKQKCFTVTPQSLKGDDKAKKEADKIKAAQEAEALKKAAQEKLRELDIESLKQPEALKVVRDLGIKPKDNKLDTLKAELVIAKKALGK